MFEEYTSITADEARTYCAGSEGQRVRDVIAERVGARTVLDYGCGPGIDAMRYDPGQYAGMDVSDALIEEAWNRHPRHTFVTVAEHRDLWSGDDDAGAFDVVYLKSILEHTPDLDTAEEILRDAMRLAREEVLVAWHTPPSNEPRLHRTVGHFGKIVHQNTYPVGAFDFARPRMEERVDNFVLWTIDVRL